jgi:hypothetical protein
VCDGNYYALAVTERLGVEESDGMVQVGIGHYNTIMLFPFWQQADNRYLAACTIFILHEIATRCFKLLVEPFAFFTVHNYCVDIERVIADFDFGFRPLLQIEIPTCFKFLLAVVRSRAAAAYPSGPPGSSPRRSGRQRCGRR